MDKKYIVSLDQGTTSSRCIIFDHNGQIVATAQREVKQIYPKPGWVEHNPMEIYASQIGVLNDALIYNYCSFCYMRRTRRESKEKKYGRYGALRRL